VLLPDLLQRFAAGDAQAFLAVYDSHAADLRPLVARFFVTPFEREEAVQEIWLQVHRVARSFDPARGELRAWLRAVAVNRCREILRARGRRPALAAELSEVEDAGADTPETLARKERVQAAIARFQAALSEEEAAVFRLALLEERSHDEVARVLGISSRRAKYLKLKLLDRAAASPGLRAVLGEVSGP
jgi:RNA polymerase sigma-70 factor (ECF subfamily)